MKLINVLSRQKYETVYFMHFLNEIDKYFAIETSGRSR